MTTEQMEMYGYNKPSKLNKPDSVWTIEGNNGDKNDRSVFYVEKKLEDAVKRVQDCLNAGYTYVHTREFTQEEFTRALGG